MGCNILFGFRDINPGISRIHVWYANIYIILIQWINAKVNGCRLLIWYWWLWFRLRLRLRIFHFCALACLTGETMNIDEPFCFFSWLVCYQTPFFPLTKRLHILVPITWASSFSTMTLWMTLSSIRCWMYLATTVIVLVAMNGQMVHGQTSWRGQPNIAFRHIRDPGDFLSSSFQHHDHQDQVASANNVRICAPFILLGSKDTWSTIHQYNMQHCHHPCYLCESV